MGKRSRIPESLLRELGIDVPPAGRKRKAGKRKAGPAKKAARSARTIRGQGKGKRTAEGVIEWCKAEGLPVPVVEHRFHPARRWKMDLEFLEQKISVEIMGGIHQGGRHTRAAGYRADCEKLNNAQLLGWKCIHLTYPDFKDGTAWETIRRFLKLPIV